MNRGGGCTHSNTIFTILQINTFTNRFKVLIINATILYFFYDNKDDKSNVMDGVFWQTYCFDTWPTLPTFQTAYTSTP